jgi:hypothetical protein
LQQSVIQIRVGGSNPNQVIPRSSSLSKDELSLTIQDLLNEKLSILTKEISSYASKESVEKVSQSLTEREAYLLGELQQVRDKLSLVQVIFSNLEYTLKLVI